MKRLLAPGRFRLLVSKIILLTGHKTIERFIETWLKGCTCEGRRIIFLLLQGNIFTEMNYCHENQSDLAKNLSTPLMIFSYSIKNKCSMASGSRWDDCDTAGAAQGNAEKECEQVPLWGCVPGWMFAFIPHSLHPPTAETCSSWRIVNPKASHQCAQENCLLCALGHLLWWKKKLKGKKPNKPTYSTIYCSTELVGTIPLHTQTFPHPVGSCPTWRIH